MRAIHSWLWRSKENLDSPFHTVVLVFLVATLSYLSTVLGSGMAVPPHNISPLWLTNAIVLVVLLAVPRRLWPILMATAYLVVGFLDVRFGTPIALEAEAGVHNLSAREGEEERNTVAGQTPLGGFFTHRRYRNIYTLAVAQTILGICLAAAIPNTVHHHMRVGIGYLNFQ